MSNDHTILVSRSVDMTLLDEELRVAADVQCDRCGYNLRTLSVDARCPECNKPVEASLREPLLAHASASHLRILHAGAWLITSAFIAILLVFLIITTEMAIHAAGVAPRLPANPLPPQFPPALVVIATWLGLVGLLLFTDPDKRRLARGDDVTARRGVRILTWAELLNALLLTVAAVTGGWMPSWLNVTWCPSLMLLAIAVIILPVVVCEYFRDLLHRDAPNVSKLAPRLAVFYYIGGLLAAGLLFACSMGSFLAAVAATALITLLAIALTATYTFGRAAIALGGLARNAVEYEEDNHPTPPDGKSTPNDA